MCGMGEIRHQLLIQRDEDAVITWRADNETKIVVNQQVHYTA